MRSTKSNVLEPVLYDRVRMKLEQERDDLENRVHRMEAQLLNLGVSNEECTADTGPDQEALIERSCHCRRKLKLVIQTLQRIREGMFGFCVLCEEPIGEKRLEALPTAKYCLNCQEQLERVDTEH